MGEMTDIRWTSSAGPRQYGTSKMRTSPPTRLASCLAPSSFVRSVRPMQNRSGRSHNVSPPSIVPGASIRPTVGMPAAVVQASMRGRLAEPIRLPRPERDGTPVGDEQRIEGVDEVRALRLGIEHVDRRSQARQRVDEGVVLAPGDVEVDRVQEAVLGSIEGGPERRPRRLDEHVEQRSGHALGTESASGHGHAREDSGRVVCRRMHRSVPLVRACHAKAAGGARTQGPWQTRAGTGYSVGVSGYAAMAQIREAHPHRPSAGRRLPEPIRRLSPWQMNAPWPRISSVARSTIGSRSGGAP